MRKVVVEIDCEKEICGECHEVSYSDYDPGTVLTLVRTDDGDIIADISGDGEFRISGSGSQFKGSGIIKRFSEIIDVFKDLGVAGYGE